MDFRYLDQLLNIWYDLKEKTTACCANVLNQSNEGTEFNRRGQSRGDHELSSFRTFEDTDNKPTADLVENGFDKRTDSVDMEFDEYGCESGAKISAWQAGWNVTNAIQVISNCILRNCQPQTNN